MPAKRLAFLLCEWACKPGSVIDGHLSGTHVAARLKPPPRDGRAGLLSLHGVAPDRVYSTELSPADGRALISAFPPLLVRRNQRYISVALVRGSPLAGVTRYPCPMEPGLSSRAGFSLTRAAVRPAQCGILTSGPDLVNLCSELFAQADEIPRKNLGHLAQEQRRRYRALAHALEPA